MLVEPMLFHGNAGTGDPFRSFPTLETQFEGNLPQGLDADRARELLSAWFDAENIELVRGMEMVLAGEGETNHALSLLLHLLNEGCYKPGETMPIALALANNYLYSQVSPVIREEIRKDMVAHYHFYRKVVAWQKKAFELPYDLSRLPLIPQIYWADRRAYPPEEDIVYPIHTITDYREYIDSIDTLEYFHKIAVEKKLHLGDSVPKIGRNLFLYVHHTKAPDGLSRHFYNPSPEKILRIIDRIPHDEGSNIDAEKKTVRYRGADYNINSFIWINFQRRLCEETGHSIGLCEVTSLIEMILFKAMGIPACNMVRFSRVDPRLMGGHVFAGYYNPFRKRWHNLEMIKKWDKSYLMEFVIHKPLWSHRVKDLQGKVFEQCLAPRFFKVLNFGTLERDFNKVFLSNKLSWTNTLFSQTALPDNPVDSDMDDILDFEEKILGTDPKRPDTAGDGVSDAWKLNHYCDPNTPIPADSLESPPIDGLGGGFDEQGKTTIVFVKRAGTPSADVPEINTMSAARFDDKVYLHVTFHNDIRQCKRKDNYIHFGLEGGQDIIQGFDLVVDGKGIGQSDKTRAQEPDGYKGLRGISITDVELMVPVKYFKDATSAKIVFFTAQVRGELTLPLK